MSSSGQEADGEDSGSAELQEHLIEETEAVIDAIEHAIDDLRSQDGDSNKT